MSFTRRDAVHLVSIVTTAFVVGASTPSTVFHDPHPLAIALWLISCAAPIALTTNYFHLTRKDSPARKRALVQSTHKRIVGLTSEGFNKLTPPYPDDDPDTVQLLIRMDGENAVIIKQTRRGVYHCYIVSPSGKVKREIFGSCLAAADKAWLDGPLTEERLLNLEDALRSRYVPGLHAEV
jgi:hypothetical protein